MICVSGMIGLWWLVDYVSIYTNLSEHLLLGFTSRFYENIPLRTAFCVVHYPPGDFSLCYLHRHVTCIVYAGGRECEFSNEINIICICICFSISFYSHQWTSLFTLGIRSCSPINREQITASIHQWLCSWQKYTEMTPQGTDWCLMKYHLELSLVYEQ